MTGRTAAAIPAAPEPAAVRAALLAWFGEHRRPLPWRRTPRDPYRTWVSEVMLQQTRVATVVPYYRRFVARFPTVADLAAAELPEVLALWQGLGYYRRARALHAAAREVVARHGGELPRTASALRRLPGVGPYIAAAIASLCFGEDVAALDANAVRVLARLAGERAPTSEPAVRRRLAALAAALLPPGRAGAWNEAVMELGATVCLPRRPRCGACPLAADCAAARHGWTAAIPAPRPRRRPGTVEVVLLLAVAADGRVCLERRPATGLLGGLWLPPAPERLGLPPDAGQVLCAFTHTFTHLRWRVTARWLAGLAAGPAAGELRWVGAAELGRLPLAAVTRRVLAAARGKLGWQHVPDLEVGATMAVERPNAFDFAGTKTTLVGPELRVGDPAPDFEATGTDLRPVRLADTAGQVRIFASVPSLDTGVCDTEARRFNEEVGRLGGGVALYVISMDLPFALRRWCGAADATNVRALSDHRLASFGQAYGTLQKENRLLSRAVFVVDRGGTLVHVEYVPAAGQQPDYEAAIAAAKAAR